METREGVHSLELELRGLGSHVMGVLGSELNVLCSSSEGPLTAEPSLCASLRPSPILAHIQKAFV